MGSSFIGAPFIWPLKIWEKSLENFMLYSHNHDQLDKHMIYIHLPMHAESWRRHNNRRATQFLEKYTSHSLWKGCVWEGVGDKTELQHIDPHSIGNNRVSFPFSWVAKPGAWGPSLSGTCSSIQHLLSNWSDPQMLYRGLEGSLCWVMAFSTASYLQLIEFPVH